MADYTSGEMIARYISLRDMVGAMEEAHKTRTKPYKDGMKLVENMLLQEMLAHDLNQLKSESGTAFKKTTMTVHTADKGALMAYVEEHGAFNLLTSAVSKDELKTYLEEHEDVPPPGVDVKFITEVQVRRPS